MKFTWFNLMPWPYLPDDFREKHRSVWVDIPSRLYDPSIGHHVYHGGLRIGHLFCLFHNGDMPDEKTRWSSKLFAERVLPKLRDLWPDWRHDDRWFPKPMTERRRPEEHLPASARATGAPSRA